MNEINNYKAMVGNAVNSFPHTMKAGRCLTLMSLKNQLTTTFGRDKEIKDIRQILCRRTKRNPLLIGDAGVGKTAIVEELSAAVWKDDVENKDSIRKPTLIFEISVSALMSGTKYRGDLEEKLQNILREVMEYKKAIVFIDEIHLITRIGAAEGATSVGQLLKPVLSRGDIALIGATTTEEAKIIMEDKALMRRFSPVYIKELQGETAINCLNSILKDYSKYFKIKINPDINVECLYDLVKKTNTTRPFPDNVIDVIDEAMAIAKFNKDSEIKMSDLKSALSRQTGYIII